METDERVTILEEVLAKFMERSLEILAANREDIAAIREDVAEFRAHSARTDRQLLQVQQQAEREREQARKERQQDLQRADQERREFNKRLAELSDSMGTLIEDMVAPCGFKLAQAVFGDQEAQTCAIRLKAKHPANPGEVMELELLAVGPTKVLVVEVKRRVDAAKAEDYRQKLARLPEFFPALAGKTVCAAIASVYIEPSVITFLSRQKLYAIAMGDEVMEVMNLGQF